MLLLAAEQRASFKRASAAAAVLIAAERASFKRASAAAVQSRCQSPRSSVEGIVRLWENAEENQPLIGCLIISLTHSLLIEMRAILIIQEAK